MLILESLINMPGFLPVLGTLTGALITGLFLYLTNKTNKQSEERKHHKELIFKTAFDSWKQRTDIAIEKMKSGHSSKILPLDSHIINLMAFSKTFSDKTISKDTVLKELEKIDEINDIVEKYYLTKHPHKKSSSKE